MSGIIPTDPVVFYVDDGNLVAINEKGNIRTFRIGDLLTCNKTIFSTENNKVKISTLQRQIKITSISPVKNYIVIMGVDVSKDGEIIPIKLPTNYITSYIGDDPTVHVVKPYKTEYDNNDPSTKFVRDVVSFGGKTKRRKNKRYSRRK